MTRKETAEFMERIRLHYPNKFIVDKIKINTWYNTLQNFSFDELNEKLERHLKNEEFADRVPSLDFLVRYATPENYVDEDYIIECKKCSRYFEDHETYSDHIDRCIRITTMIRDMKNYFDINLSREKMEMYNDRQINELYNRYVDRMLNEAENLSSTRRDVLEKCKIICVDN